MNKTKVTIRKGSKPKTKKNESPEVFVLPPNLLEKLGINLGNYGSAPESTEGFQVTDSNISSKDNGSRENKLACKKDTDSNVTTSSEIESSIIETAELMKKSVFLSPTFISNNTSVIQGEIEIVGNVVTEDIEVSAGLLNNEHCAKAVEELSIDIHKGHVPISNVETTSSNQNSLSTQESIQCDQLVNGNVELNNVQMQTLLDDHADETYSISNVETSTSNQNSLSTQESIQCDQLVNGNVEMNNAQMQTLLDDHADEAYSSDCSNSNMGYTAKSELKYNQNKINIISEQIILPSHFYKLESNYSPEENSLIHVQLNTMINQNNNQVSIPQNDLNMASIPNVANIVPTEITVVNECDMHGQHFVEGDTNLTMEDDEILQNSNEIGLCAMLKEAESEFIISTPNLETSQQDKEGFQNPFNNHMIIKDDMTMDRCIIVPCPIDVDNGSNLVNNCNDKAVEESFKMSNTDSYFDETTGEKYISEIMSSESKSDILEDSNKNSSTSSCIIEKEKESKITSFSKYSHIEANLQTEDTISDSYAYKKVLPSKKEFNTSEINNTEQSSVLQNGEIDSINNDKAHSSTGNKKTNSSVLENLSEDVNSNINEAKLSGETLEKKKNKNYPGQETSTSPIFYIKRHKNVIRENNEFVHDEGKQKYNNENSEPHEIKTSDTDSLESKKLKVGHMNITTGIQEDKVKEIAKYLSEFADMKKRNHFTSRHKMVNSKTLSKKKDTTSLKLSIQGVEKPGGSEITKQDKLHPPVKTYERRCMQRRKTVPSFVFKDCNKSTESINLTDSSSSNIFCHDIEECLCDDFGRLKLYDEISSYEHIHFWNRAKTDYSAEIIFSIYSEDASAAGFDNEVMNVTEEYPSLTSHEPLYKLCWNEFKGISDNNLDAGDVGEESNLVKKYSFKTEKKISACSDENVENKKCNEKKEPEKEVDASPNNKMINVNLLQKCEGMPTNKNVADVYSARTGQKRKRSIVFSDEGEPPAKNSKRRISERLSQTKEGLTNNDEEQIATNSVKISPSRTSISKALGPTLSESTPLSAQQACSFLSESPEPRTKIPEKVETHQLSKNENNTITCGVCQQGVKDEDWMNHIASKHNYLAWKCGEPCLDPDDETAVREYLYGITKVYGGLTCAKCGLTRKYVKAYLSHIRDCTGVNETSSHVRPGVESVEHDVKKERSDNTSFVKCGVCGESMQDIHWNDHRASRHDYLSWKCGEPSLDVNNEAAVREHLYEITKACGGLTCAKCGLTRKYVKAYLSHIRTCIGLSESQNDSAYDVSSEVIPEVETADVTVNYIGEEDMASTSTGLITCGVCKESVEVKDWNHHIASRHDYLAWKNDDEPLDVNDEVAVREHLYEITKACGGLTCAKCGLTRKYVKAYLSHIKKCDGLNESQNDSTYNVSSDEVKLSAVVNGCRSNTEITNEDAVTSTALVKCAVCEESIKEKDWHDHIASRHNYLAWKIGDAVLDVNDETTVRDHLYQITKACDGLTCAKCGLTRKYVKAYLSHVKSCNGPDNSRNESASNITTDISLGIESVELANDSINKIKREIAPKKAALVTCAVCEESVQEMDWYNHIGSRHDYLAWRLGEPSLDVNDESAVRNHLHIITNAYDGLTCSKCGLNRKYVKVYLSHFKNCNGLSESQNDVSISTEVSGMNLADSCTTYVNESQELLVKCAVCAEYMIEINWNNHIASQHDYLAWKDGEECLDLQDEEAVGQHLRHILRQNAGLTCAKCGTNITCVKSYLSHIKSKSCQNKITNLEDGSQNLALETQASMNKRHKSTTAEDDSTLVKCGVCGQYSAKHDWIQHIADNHEYMAWKDGQPPLDTNDEQEVRLHLRSIIKEVGNLLCQKCDAPQKTVKSYMYHINNCGDNEEDIKSTFKCGACDEIVVSLHWETHLSEKHDYLAWKDGETPLNVDDEDDVNQHLYKLSKLFGCLTCKKCGLTRKYVKSYLEHIQICNGAVIPEPKPKPLPESHPGIQDNSVVDFSSGGTCAVCHKEIDAGKWIQHTQKEHNYLAWREGEKSWNLDDFEDLNKYLYIICKRMDGLTCNKCGLVRKYVKVFLTHIKNCDVIDFNLDSAVAEGVGPLNKEVVQCAMCKEQIKRSDWKNHKMTKHYNITWIIGETPIDIKNPYAVERYLKDYKQAYGRLKCNVCNASRASFAGFYAHIIVCGKSEEEIDLFKSECDICHSKYLCIYKNQHAMTHRVQEYMAELKMKKVENNLKLNTEPDLSGKRRAAVKARSVIENYSDKMSKHAHSCQSCGFGTDFEDELKTHKCEVSNEKDFSGDESSAAEIGSSEEESGDTDVDSNISNEVNDDEENVDDEDGDEDDDGLVVKKIIRRRERAPSKIPRIPFKVEDPATFVRQGDEDFCNTYLTDEVLFPEWQCVGKSQLEAVPDSEMIRYLPPLEQSCKVKYDSGWATLNKFETKKDVTGISLFAGASIICIAWAPLRVADIREGSTNFLAVSCHNGADCPRYRGNETPTHENLIQIWNFGKFERLPRLVLGIAHDFGTVWSMDWCPSGARDALSDGEEVPRRLGLLAVACSSGSAYIFAVPYPSSTVQNTQFVHKMKPVAELRMTMGSERKKYQATSVSWSKQKGHNLVLVGYADGSTAYYDLHSTSPLLLTLENNVQVFHPYNDERPHNTCITGTDLYPVSGDAAGAGAGAWTAPTGAELAARAGGGATGRVRMFAATQAVEFAPHAGCAVLGGDDVIMHTAISELAVWPPGRRFGGIRTMAGCARCGRVVASTPPILRVMRPHPAFFDSKKQVVGLLEMVHLAKKRKKQVNDELGMVLEPLTYDEAITKYGITFKRIRRTDRVKQNEYSAKPKAHCPERFPLADVKSMAFCPSRKHHEKLALATHAGILFLTTVN